MDGPLYSILPSPAEENWKTYELYDQWHLSISGLLLHLNCQVSQSSNEVQDVNGPWELAPPCPCWFRFIACCLHVVWINPRSEHNLGKSGLKETAFESEDWTFHCILWKTTPNLQNNLMVTSLWVKTLNNCLFESEDTSYILIFTNIVYIHSHTGNLSGVVLSTK